jgi:hypothetical protein
LPLRRRRLFVVRASPSLDGGLPLVWLSLASRASNSCTRAANNARVLPRLLVSLAQTGVLGFQRGVFLFKRHAPMLRLHRKSA